MFVKDRSTTLEINSLATLISLGIHSFHLSESVSDTAAAPITQKSCLNHRRQICVSVLVLTALPEIVP